MGSSQLFRSRAAALAGVLLALVWATGAGPACAAPAITFAFDGAEGGDLGDDLKGLLRPLSRVRTLDKDATEREIRRAASADVKQFRNALRAAGYFQADVSYETAAATEEDDKPGVSYQVTTGPLYRIDANAFRYLDEAAKPRPASPEELGLDEDLVKLLKRGSAVASDRTAIGAASQTWFRTNGYPKAKLRGAYVEARRETALARAIYEFETGERTAFGAVQWPEGRVDPEFLARFQSWRQGDPFDRSRLPGLRDEILATNLYSSVTVSPGEYDPETGETPVVVLGEERKRRTLGAGLSYSTNFGAGANAFWEHRNVFGGGERARAELEVAQVNQSLSGSFRKPLQRPGAVIDYDMILAHEANEAFESYTATIGFAYDRPFWRDNRLSTGVEVEAADIRDSTGTRQTVLLSTPIELYRSTIRNPLDPTGGSRISISASPHAGDGGLYFGLFEGAATAHFPVIDDDKLVFSSWSRLGFTLGPDTFDLPATKRFYAGGAGSIRGFGFRLASPIDEDNDPIGGRSVWEAGGEARLRIGSSYGVVAFLEGGSAFDSAYPDFQSEPLIGAGVGVRYYTPVGPIRFDVAVPVNRRSGVDDPVQIYISIGQAF